MPRLLALLPLLATAACAGMAPSTQSVAATTTAPKAAPVSALDIRVEQLVPVLKGEFAPEDYFDATFLAAVPPAQFGEITAGLIAEYGQPSAVLGVTKTGANGALVQVAFEKAVGTIEIGVGSQAGAKVNMLLTRGFALTGDSIEKIDADFASLPGKAGYVVQELQSADQAVTKAARNADMQFAIGSTFKLYVLAELASEVDGDTRKWSDVVPLSHQTMSSSGTKNWPKNTPVTLQSLATWMISVSDNSATDTLLHVLGRSKVEEKLALVGHSDPDLALPILSTSEAFALKSAASASLREQYLKAKEAGQRQLLDSNKLEYDANVGNPFADGPAYIDSIEWFASPTDVVRLLNNIRAMNNQTALDILTVNKALSDPSASKWTYVGYKGGSEPGVMSMSYLLQAKDGRWFAVSGSWNDATKEVDQGKFAGLMSRLVDLQAK